MEKLSTKVTRLGNGGYGCRVLKEGKPALEIRVKFRNEVGSAFFDMLRTLNKLGSDSKMAHASRHRGKGHCVHYKYIWY